MPRRITCYPSRNKREAAHVAAAFAEGVNACGDIGTVAPPGENKLRDGAAVFYGMTDHTLPLIRQCENEGREWYYIDNAYYYGRGMFKRVTRGSLMHDGRGEYSSRRWDAFREQVKPWRKGGQHVVLTTQSELFYTFRLGMTRDEWTTEVRRQLRDCCDYPVRVCHKPESKAMRKTDPHSRAFEPLLRGAYMMATHSSSTAVKALAEGIPVLWLGGPDYSMCRRMSITSPQAIGDPYFPDDRRAFFSALMANQWTKQEMKAGKCWRDLNER